MSEYDDARSVEPASDETPAEPREESAEDQRGADLVEAARLLGAGEDEVQEPAPAEPDKGTAALGEPPTAEAPEPEIAAEVVEEIAEDEDPVEALRHKLEGQYGDWYVVHSYAGYENKVKTNLESRIQSLDMEDYIYQVEVPTEDVVEIKNGKRQQVQRKVFPGYILVRMELNDES